MILVRNCACTKKVSQQQWKLMVTVFKLFREAKEGSSTGPDNISGQLHKNCTGPLAEIFFYIFTNSLHLHEFLTSGKTL